MALVSTGIKIDHFSPRGNINIRTHFVPNLKIETNTDGKNLRYPQIYEGAAADEHNDCKLLSLYCLLLESYLGQCNYLWL